MAVYAIMLDSPGEKSWAAIKEKWPGAYVHKDKFAFVADDGTRLTKEIAEEAGIGSGREGMVIQLDYYYGFSDPTLVEWLRKNT